MGSEPTIQLGNTLITVQLDGLDGQRLLIQATTQGETLARLLTGGEKPPREDGVFVVSHDVDVDARLVDLVDALTAIRWLHPTFTQLVLDVDFRAEESS